VVADEVRKLAKHAAASAREIDGILSGFRSETMHAAGGMRTSAESMNGRIGYGTRMPSSTFL
jgi:methyl-accepting chemotaxis protein